MDILKLKAEAKINLSLDVIGKRPDGYHDVKMIMQSVSLFDIVTIEAIQEGIEIYSNSRWVPSDSRNTTWKAANLLINKFGINYGVRINIDKRIPVAAGLGGGSADAAAVLKGINSLFDLGISYEELAAIGKEIGADVPFCVRGGTMLAEGIGERLTPLKPMKNVNIVIVKPNIAVSTAWVYKNLDLEKIEEHPDTELLVNAVNLSQHGIIAKNMKNVLEYVTISKYQVIDTIKKKLVSLGALGSMMSGSGPSVFAIFEDAASAKNAFDKIKNGKWNCFIATTTDEER